MNQPEKFITYKKCITSCCKTLFENFLGKKLNLNHQNNY